MKNKYRIISIGLLSSIVSGDVLPVVEDPENMYTYPAEDTTLHEATWLQWPHNYGWDPVHEERYQTIWIEMTKALHTGEKVRIIAYDEDHEARVDSLLRDANVDMSQIEFFIYPTDDVWTRDNGPLFVFDKDGKMIVEDWVFNGWGGKQEWGFDDIIPEYVASDLSLPLQPVPMVNEAGSIEVDGRGTMMAKKSSILNDNRNPGVSQDEAERYFKRYLGVTNFIWLNGIIGLDITDDHIDGDARFANDDTIVTHYPEDFEDQSEYDILANATDVDGELYNIVHLPKTSVIIPELTDYGVYMNFYVGNEVVVFPVFGDPNDDIAAAIIQELYPEKAVTQITFTELYIDGGLAHCVTMQQPAVTNEESESQTKSFAVRKGVSTVTRGIIGALVTCLALGL